jgi:hypothetical protein
VMVSIFKLTDLNHNSISIMSIICFLGG